MVKLTLFSKRLHGTYAFMIVCSITLNNIAGSSLNWVLHKINAIQQCAGISYGDCDNQFIALLTTIEVGYSLETKSRLRKAKS